MKIIIKTIAVFLITLASIFIILPIVPLTTSTYKITRDNQVIIYQGMIHIGSTEYYNDINKDIINYKNKGYVYLYEMIKVTSESDKKEMISLLGLEADTFSNIANATNLDSQHNHMINTEQDVNADITSSELIQRFKDSGIKPKTEIVQASSTLNTIFGSFLSDNFITTSISRSIMKLGLFTNDLFSIDIAETNDVIINQRNNVLIMNIIQQGNNNIYVQYGDAHFKDLKVKLEALGYSIEKIDSKKVF